MHLKRAQHSRLKKQWRFLSKQLKQLTEQGKFQQLAAAKKTFLKRRLKQLFQQMLRFEKASKLKKALGAAALLLGLQTTPLQAQVTFISGGINPFGLTFNPEHRGAETLADIDGDGDLDLITLSSNQTWSLSWWENMSNNGGTIPHFVEPVSNLGGIIIPEVTSKTFTEKLGFGDLDNDGDLDLIIGASVNYSSEAQLYFFENTGDINTPVFAEAVVNPYNIDLNEAKSSILHLMDLDNDGDLDLMGTLSFPDNSKTFQYLENIGTDEFPNFAPPQISPFGLPDNANYYSLLDFGDIDSDGDIDMLSGRLYIPYNYYGVGTFEYIENIGTPENPQFTTPVEDPFSIIGSYDVRPILGDLDNDGDLDMLNSPYYPWPYGDNPYWSYRENLLNPLAINEPTLAATTTVFPSVSNSVVNLSVQTETVQSYFLINVFAMNGKLLHQHKIAGGTTVNQQIDLSNYPAGQYLIQVRTPDGVLVRKAIKQ